MAWPRPDAFYQSRQRHVVRKPGEHKGRPYKIARYPHIIARCPDIIARCPDIDPCGRPFPGGRNGSSR